MYDTSMSQEVYQRQSKPRRAKNAAKDDTFNVFEINAN